MILCLFSCNTHKTNFPNHYLQLLLHPSSPLLCQQKVEVRRRVARATALGGLPLKANEPDSSATALPLEANEPDDGRPSQPAPHVELSQHSAAIQISWALPHVTTPTNHTCTTLSMPCLTVTVAAYPKSLFALLITVNEHTEQGCGLVAAGRGQGRTCC